MKHIDNNIRYVQIKNVFEILLDLEVDIISLI